MPILHHHPNTPTLVREKTVGFQAESHNTTKSWWRGGRLTKATLYILRKSSPRLKPVMLLLPPSLILLLLLPSLILRLLLMACSPAALPLVLLPLKMMQTPFWFPVSTLPLGLPLVQVDTTPHRKGKPKNTDTKKTDSL